MESLCRKAILRCQVVVCQDPGGLKYALLVYKHISHLQEHIVGTDVLHMNRGSSPTAAPMKAISAEAALLIYASEIMYKDPS